MSDKKDKKRERIIDRRQKTNVSDPFAQDFSSVFSELLQASEENSVVDDMPETLEANALETVTSFDAKTEVATAIPARDEAPDMVSRAERIESAKQRARKRESGQRRVSQRQPISEIPSSRRQTQAKRERSRSGRQSKPVPRGALPAGARRIGEERTEPAQVRSRKGKDDKTRLSSRGGIQSGTSGLKLLTFKKVFVFGLLGLLIGSLLAGLLYEAPPVENKALEEAERLYAEGNKAYQEQDMEKALTMYRKASSVYPEYLEARKAEANLLSQLGQNEAAIKAFERYLKLDKKSPYAQFVKDNIEQYEAEKENIEKKQADLKKKKADQNKEDE